MGKWRVMERWENLGLTRSVTRGKSSGNWGEIEDVVGLLD